MKLINYTFNENYTKLESKEYNQISITEILSENLLSSNQSVNQPSNQSVNDLDFNSDLNLDFKTVKIKNIEKLPCTWKKVYKIKFAEKMNYEIGDSIGILAPNSDESVRELFSLLKIKDKFVSIERTGLQPFSFQGKISDFFKYKLEISGIPRKQMLLNLASKECSESKDCLKECLESKKCLKESLKSKELEYLASKEGNKDYLRLGIDWINLIEIIKEFDCKPKLEDLLLNCDIIKPRYYSLINKSGFEGEIILGIIEKDLNDNLNDNINDNLNHNLKCNDLNDNLNTHSNNYSKMGHVSSFIHKNYKNISQLQICFRKNILLNQIPKKLICFCTGTGIASFLSIFNNLNLEYFKLFYGFRNDEDDLTKYFDDLIFNDFNRNISYEIIRVKSNHKKYVYDYVKDIENDIEKNDIGIFICGNMKMQKSVFLEIKKYFPEIISGKRLYFDSWQ